MKKCTSVFCLGLTALFLGFVPKAQAQSVTITPSSGFVSGSPQAIYEVQSGESASVTVSTTHQIKVKNNLPSQITYTYDWKTQNGINNNIIEATGTTTATIAPGAIYTQNNTMSQTASLPVGYYNAAAYTAHIKYGVPTSATTTTSVTVRLYA